MMRTIIIDDELIGISTLKVLIEKYTEGLRVVASTTDPEQGIDLIADYRPDIVFLDVSMPKMNGFELLERLSYRDFRLVFTTAHQEYAIQAIRNKAYDYLLKPIDIEELRNCVTKIRQEKTQQMPVVPSEHIIGLSVKDGFIFIRPEEIIRLEAAGSYTVFYLMNNVKHVASKNLKDCEAMLIPAYFYRCHASHIVNLKKVVKMVSTNGLFAQMSDGSMPEIGRKNKDTFLEKLKAL